MNTDTTPEAVVEEYWPYDGPHTADTVIAAADAVAQLTRYLNNATRGTDIPAPDLYEATSHLTAAADGLDQLCGEFATHARRHMQNRALRHEDYREDSIQARATAADAAAAFDAARPAVANLRAHLARAQDTLSHLYHDTGE